MDSTGTKACKACSERKPISEYGPCKKSKDRLEYRCRSCVRAYMNARNAAGKRGSPRLPLTCERCGVTFQPPRVGPALQRYCSDPCAKAANRSERERLDAAGARKQCRMCGEWRERIHFQLNDGCTDGRVHTCYTCSRTAKKALRRARDIREGETKECSQCGKTFPATPEYWYDSPDCVDGLKRECKGCSRRRSGTWYHDLPASQRHRYKPEQWQALRLECLQHYSGGVPRCACCGTDILAFLTIDHISGDGNAHRRQMKQAPWGAGSIIQRWIKNHNYPEGFQVLCYSCNAGKGQGAVCCHQLPPPDPATMSYNDRYLYRLRREVMTHYGNGVCACTCCGEATLRLLTIDHIDGGGRQHFKELGIIGGGSFWRWLRAEGYPPGYRTACYNCNLGNGVYRRFGEWERCPAHEQRSPHPPHAAES